MTEGGADGDRAGGTLDVDRPDDRTKLGTLWIRWTDCREDVHLHRICEPFPAVTVTGSFPFVRLDPEPGEKPMFSTVGDNDGGEAQFRFVGGLPRWMLRHVPFVILVAMLVLFVGAEFIPRIGGVSDLLPRFTGRDVALFGVYLLVTPLLLWLLATIGADDHRQFLKGEFLRACVVYGLVGGLGFLVAVSIYLVGVAEHPSEVEPNVVFVSGWLLTLLLGGMLLYDGILKIEHLFTNLACRRDVVGNERAYRRFLTDLNDSFHAQTFRVPTRNLFGVLFAGQFVIIWIIGSGPQTFDYAIGVLVNAALDAVMAALFFQFVILTWYFNRLLNVSSEYADVDLTYEPFHVDGHGGFRDFGRFATRINIILSLAGLYLVYRLYVVGGQALPREGITGFEDPLLLTVWVLNFAGPVAAYALGAGAWGYLSFWSLHEKMVRDKHLRVRKYQGSRVDAEFDRTPSAGDSIDSFGGWGPEWTALRQAPTWPVDVSRMAGLLSGNLIPLLIPVGNLLL